MSRGPSKFTFEPSRTRAVNGKCRIAAALTRCGRTTGTSFSSRLWITTSWWQRTRRKGDSFVADKPRVWSEKQIGGTVGNRNVDLAPDSKRIVALMPVDTAERQKAQNHVIFLENFFDEVRRRPLRKPNDRPNHLALSHPGEARWRRHGCGLRSRRPQAASPCRVEVPAPGDGE